MVDIYRAPMVNVRDAALYLGMPSSTLSVWRRDRLVHGVEAGRRGWPNLPFIGVVEAFVLRSLRGLGFTRRQINEAVVGVRKEFGDSYALARPGIGHDQGAEIFLRIGGEYFRARDRQQAVETTVKNFSSFIDWEGQEPARLRLQQFGNVYLDPRFGWGKATLPNRVPLESVISLWLGNETLENIAEEFDMQVGDVDAIVRSWGRAAA